MSSRKHRKATGDSARKSQPAAPRQEAQQPEARAPQFANQIGLAGSANPAVQAVQLQRLGTQSPSRAGRAARQLQRAYGNRYMAQVAQQARAGAGSSPIVQPKLAVTPPNDQYEDEADRVAGQVMRALDTPQPDTYEDEADRPAGQVMRALDASDPDKYEDEADRPAGQVMRKDVSAAAPAAGIAVPSGVEAAIEGARRGGQPLPDGTRAAMESALGADFGGVRVHTDRESGALNEALSARAFTTGQDIFFKQGEYAPGSAEGQRLLAHELTHVVQQRQVRLKPALQGKGVPINGGALQRDIDLPRAVGQGLIQRALSYATPANPNGKTQLDADVKAKVKAVTRFQQGEAISNAPGAASSTASFTNANDSDQLENVDIRWGAKKLGTFKPIGKPSSGASGAVSFDPGVKMHLVNSFLHPDANSWAENWVWGHGELNHAHERDIESVSKDYHPSFAKYTLTSGKPIYALSYRTEVVANATPTAKTADDLAADIAAKINNYVPLNFTGVQPADVKANVTINGQGLTAYHGRWQTAITNTVASKVTSFARIYGVDGTGDVESEDVTLGPGSAEVKAPVQYNIVLLTDLAQWFSDQGIFQAPVGRSKRGATGSGGSGPRKGKTSS
jgi:hypothetical protein